MVTGLDPLAWHGGAFLSLFAVLLLATVAGFAIAAWLRPKGRPARLASADEYAVLTGKCDRFAETLLVRMLQRDLLALEGGKLVTYRAGAGTDEVERAVLSIGSPLGWGKVRRATDLFADRIEQRLIASGLLMKRGAARWRALIATLPLMTLLGFCFIKFRIESDLHRPVGLLLLFLLATTVAVLILWRSVNRQTRAGLAIWHEARVRFAWLRQGATGHEAGMAAALFGIGVLAGSPLTEFKNWRHPVSGKIRHGVDGGGGSGCGGSGCGGSGCGGGCGGGS